MQWNSRIFDHYLLTWCERLQVHVESQVASLLAKIIRSLSFCTNVLFQLAKKEAKTTNRKKTYDVTKKRMISYNDDIKFVLLSMIAHVHTIERLFARFFSFFPLFCIATISSNNNWHEVNNHELMTRQRLRMLSQRQLTTNTFLEGYCQAWEFSIFSCSIGRYSEDLLEQAFFAKLSSWKIYPVTRHDRHQIWFDAEKSLNFFLNVRQKHTKSDEFIEIKDIHLNWRHWKKNYESSSNTY